MSNYRLKSTMQCFTVALGLSLSSMQPISVSASELDEEESEGRIQFTDIAKLPGTGIDYRRTKSRHDVLWNAIRSKPVASIFDFAAGAPVRSRGVPGVAVFDYDRDGDLDIYVPNGPGSPNSLYSNQLAQGKGVTFVDVGIAAGVDAADKDSTGVCYGDTDNDGDYDLYVLSLGEANVFYQNNGNGTFTNVTSRSAVGGRNAYSTSCAMGDVNGDGLLDIVISNTTENWDNSFFPTDHNELLLNKGNNRFEDHSVESGITELAGFLPEQAGAAGLTWSITMIDYDLDGDIDIMMGDDQSGHPVAGVGLKGFVHVMRNDGTGHFQDVSVEAGTNLNGAWMGFSFGDLDFDGQLDMFVSNIGDYMNAEYFPYQLGSLASRYFLGRSDGTFAAQQFTGNSATAFGWGNVMTDYDNDGDTDIIYRGGMDGGPLIDASNPGIVLVNDGEGNLTEDMFALAAAGHDRRNVQGMAQGDFNQDGFIDLVSVSNFDIPQSVPLTRYTSQWGAVLDDSAFFVRSYTPVAPFMFSWNGYEFPNGTLSIDINNAASEYGSVSVDLLGTAGILENGRSNRDGVGATVRFTPKGGKTAMHPIVAGDSYASQSELTARFGLGEASKGTVDVLWPGGARNRLYGVKEGETVLMPEIPCSYVGDWQRVSDYRRCVDEALRELVENELLSADMQHRLFESAIKAYAETH